MKERIAILAALIAIATIAYAAESQKGKCPATPKQCEYYIREMLSGKRYLGVKVEDTRWGVRVTHIIPDSPAESAGIQVGDRIFAVNGRECTRGGSKQFKALLNEAGAKEGGKVYLTIVRVGRLLRLGARMTEMSKDEINKVVAAHLKEAHPDTGNR